MSTNLGHLEKQLHQARTEFGRIACSGRTMDDIHRSLAVEQRIFWLERHIGRLRAIPTAIRIAWPLPWLGSSAARPVVASGGLRAFLLYAIKEKQTEWPVPPSQFRIVSMSDSEPRQLAMVTVSLCRQQSLPVMSHEDLQYHPLFGRGLEPGRAHRVVNSTLPRGLGGDVRKLKHYVLVFHDYVFECVAAGLALRRLQTTYSDALEMISREIING